MDPFLSDRHARWHPVDLSLFPLRPPPTSLHHHEIPNHPPGVPESNCCWSSELEGSTRSPGAPEEVFFLVVGRPK